MEGEHAAPEPRSVLVVEDEFLIAMELVGLLEAAGYGVLGPATTVEGALALLEGHQPDACILDVNLRGTRSAPVAEALKAQNVPFMLSSAYEKATLDQYPAFEGITNIGKPASPERLLSQLGALLREQSRPSGAATSRASET